MHLCEKTPFLTLRRVTLCPEVSRPLLIGHLVLNPVALIFTDKERIWQQCGAFLPPKEDLHPDSR